MASELANKIYKGINEKYCKRKLSILSLVLIDEIIKEYAAQQGVQPTYTTAEPNPATWVINPSDIQPPEISG